MLETNGKRITHLSLGAGILVTFTVGTLVLLASIVGLPAPLTQGTTGAIMGVGFGIAGRKAMSKQVVRDIGTVWLLSPTISLLMSYLLVNLVTGDNALSRPLTYVLLSSGLMVTAGTLLLINRPRLKHSLMLIRKRAVTVKRIVTAMMSPLVS
ncbi:MAG: inorganic phosphate transporter [Chloroflexi bacterium]|nr:inorganic phosphate transporter [Chloroflexota bacterium]